MATAIYEPLPVFHDVDGTPLENGKVYIGTVNLDAKTNQVAAYWDEDLTMPVSQPIRTLNGYPSYQGAATPIYTAEATFSLRTYDANDVPILNVLDASTIISVAEAIRTDAEAAAAQVAADKATVAADKLLAQGYRDAAENAQEAAEDASDAAIGAVNATTYVDTAAGLAATSVGEFFTIPSAETDGYLDLYEHESGPTATLRKTSVAKSALDRAVEAVGEQAATIGISFAHALSAHVRRISPSGTWSGTAGSGWSSGEPSATTRNPLGNPQPEIAPFDGYYNWPFNARKRLLFRVKENQRDRYPVTMRVHLEGNTIDIPRDTLETYAGEDGIERKAWLRAFDLDHANFSTDGWCRFYVEAIPSDPNMDSRIIGPFEMKRKTGDLWDAVLTFGSGGTYADLTAARNGISASHASAEHIWLKPVASHSFSVVGMNWFGATAAKKVLLDSGDPSITLTIEGASWQATANQFRPKLNGMVYGPSIVFDMTRMASVYSESTYTIPPEFRGCLFDNPEGAANPFGVGTVAAGNVGNTATVNPDQGYARNSPYITGNFTSNLGYFPIMLECREMYPARSAMTMALITRNCTMIGGTEDILSPSNGTPQYRLQYGTRVHDATPAPWRTPIDAMTVEYSGAAATAQVSVTSTDASNPNNTTKLRVNLIEDSVTVLSIPVSITIGSGNYTVQDVVDAVNAQADWSATLVDGTRRAALLGGPYTMAPVDAKSAPATIGAAQDIHGDVWQTFAVTSVNWIAENNVFTNMGGFQIFFLNQQSGSVYAVDCVLENNFYFADLDDPDNAVVQSQISGGFGNVRISHNYIPHQQIVIRKQSVPITAFDSYSAITANVIANYSEHAELAGAAPALTVVWNQSVGAGASAYPDAGRDNFHDNLVDTELSMAAVPSYATVDVYEDERLPMSRRGALR